MPPIICNYIDSHVHLDHIFSDHPDRIEWLIRNGCVPVSWSFCKPVDTVSDIRQCLANHAEIIRELSGARLPSYYLAGVHPRNITKDLKPERIGELLMPHLENPLCLGIGEIGLETGSTREKEILLAHLELGAEVTGRGKKIGIHTPRENKAEVARQTLEVLNDFTDYQPHIVVDHCTPQIIEGVLAAGVWAGVTLSPVKASVVDVLEIIRDYGASLDRIMLNTDSGTSFYNDLHVFARSAQVDDDVKAALTLFNAECFFEIKWEENLIR